MPISVLFLLGACHCLVRNVFFFVGMFFKCKPSRTQIFMIYARSNRIVPDPEQDRGEHALPNIASTNEETTTSAILFICHLQGISDVVPVLL